MNIAVGSHNPVKLEAVRLGFEAVWNDAEHTVFGVDVTSGIADQPMSDEESLTGARNRAKEALRESPGAHFGVGLEGGLHKIGGQYFDCGWIVVVDKEGREGIGSTARILTPPKIVELIEQGMELGAANDALFGAVNSKQAQGHFGLMTNNAMTRTGAYRDGVIVALSRFLHPHLF